MKQEKNSILDQILGLIPKSRGLLGFTPLGLEDWEKRLKQLTPEVLVDFLHMLKEEQEMLMAIEQKTKKRHQINLTRYLQKMEAIHLKLESLTTSHD